MVRLGKKFAIKPSNLIGPQDSQDPICCPDIQSTRVSVHTDGVFRTRDVAQWWLACLADANSWVPFHSQEYLGNTKWTWWGIKNPQTWVGRK